MLFMQWFAHYLSIAVFLCFVGTVTAWMAAAASGESTMRVTKSGKIFGWGPGHFALEYRSPVLGADVVVVPDVSSASFLGFRWSTGHASGAAGGEPEYRLLLIPFWCATLVTGVLPALWLTREFRRLRFHRRTRQGLCPTCGYDLRASPTRCPECGRKAEVVA